MIIFYSERFKKNFKNFSEDIKLKFEKQIIHLLRNIHYPSLHAKKYNETCGIWQARVDKNVRFYFLIDGAAYILLDIKQHPK